MPLPNQTFEDKILAELGRINTRLEALEAQLEAKAYDTKPIWERALAEILAVKRQGEDVDVRLDRIESAVSATRSEMLTLRADFKQHRHEQPHELLR